MCQKSPKVDEKVSSCCCRPVFLLCLGLPHCQAFLPVLPLSAIRPKGRKRGKTGRAEHSLRAGRKRRKSPKEEKKSWRRKNRGRFGGHARGRQQQHRRLQLVRHLHLKRQPEDEAAARRRGTWAGRTSRGPGTGRRPGPFRPGPPPAMLVGLRAVAALQRS